MSKLINFKFRHGQEWVKSGYSAEILDVGIDVVAEADEDGAKIISAVWDDTGAALDQDDLLADTNGGQDYDYSRQARIVNEAARKYWTE